MRRISPLLRSIKRGLCPPLDKAQSSQPLRDDGIKRNFGYLNLIKIT